MEQIFSLEIKSIGTAGQFTGYASVFGNVDSDNEVIDKGAFKRTLDHSKGVVPILWQHDRTRPVGWNRSAEEDGHGLKVAGELMMDTPSGKTAHEFLKGALRVGAKPGLSVGFSVPPGGDYVKDGKRHFREIALKEYSIVTFPANELAAVTGAKDGLGLAPDAIRRALENAQNHLTAARDLHRQSGERLQAAYDAFAPIPAYYANDVNAPNPAGGGKDLDDAEEAKLLSDALEFLKGR